MKTSMWLPLLLLAGCATTEPERVCTLIGCSDGLSVVVNSSLQQQVTVTVSEGTQVLQTFTCNPGQPCQTFIENRTPAQVNVAVATTQGTISKQYTPEYKISKPNGPDCPPDCRQATITVTIS